MNTLKIAFKLGKIKVLNVAERPSVARSIVNVLKIQYKEEDTYSKYHPLLKFNFQLGEQEAEMWMTSIKGHLKDLKFTKRFIKWENSDPLYLLKDAEIKNVIPYEQKCFEENLKLFANECSELILWLDCDREGEKMAFEILEICKDANPQIKVHRAHFSAITQVEILNALNNLKQPDENLSNSILARQEIDLRIGASFTAFQTSLLAKMFKVPSIISFGSCQIPTLGFVVERQKQIDSFMKENFWFIECKDQNGCEYNWSRGNIYEEITVLQLFDKCVTDQAIVTDVQQKEVQKWKPYPLSTIEFEKLASKKFKISTSIAMEIAEQLYNRGFISFPKTESNKFSSTIDLKNIISNQIEDPVWGEYAKNLINSNFDQPREGNKCDKNHPPIHPVKTMLQTNAYCNREWDIYQLITRHFLACCSKNAKGCETTINLQVKEESFQKQGLIINEKNYLEIYPYDVWPQTYVPQYNKGDKVKINLKVKNGKTSSPEPLTEAELIGMMDNYGIGTDAIIHEHINTIQEREYAIKQGQTLKPTKLGLALIECYEKLGFTLHKPYLRALIEERMNQVAQGMKQKQEIVDITINEMGEILKEVLSKKDQILSTFGQYFEPLIIYDENNRKVQYEIISKTSYTIDKKTKQKIYSTILVTFKCNTCKEYMEIRQSKLKNFYYLSCLDYHGCGQAIFLPDYIQSVQCVRQKCKKCNSTLFQIEYTENSFIKPQSEVLCLYPECSEGLKTEWKNEKEVTKKSKDIRNQKNDCDQNTKTMVSSTDTNQQEKKDKVCSACGVSGRHPKGSNCLSKKVKKIDQ